MTNRPYVHTSDKLPNYGDYVELLRSDLRKSFTAIFTGVAPDGLPRFLEGDLGNPGHSLIGHRGWRHLSERYADYLDRREQGWFDSTQDGFPKDREAVWVYDTHSKEVVHCTHRASAGDHDWHPVVCSPTLFLGNQIWRSVKFTKKVTVAEVPEDAPAAPVIKPVPKPVPVAVPYYEANKAVWVTYNHKAPADGQYVWVHTGRYRLVCKHRASDSHFECVVGTEAGREFYAPACQWQTLLPPTL